MPPRRELHYRLKEWREARGFTQIQLAKEAGCTSVFVSLVERGKNQPSSAMLAAFAKALDISIDSLIVEPSPSAKNPAAHG